MKLYNTLTRAKQDFVPITDKQVGLYVCGPTVYDFAHIGNLRTYIFEDILRRTLEYDDFNVNQVMNITDVEDKLIKASQGHKDELKEITSRFEKAFFVDLEKLNIEKASNITRATKYIPQMIKLVAKLIDKGFAYTTPDGSVYYSIDKFKDYGKLSHLDKSGIKAGARVNSDEYEKENPADFVLWKAWDEKDGDIFWEPKELVPGSDIAKGRPGWHIECSAMSQDKLGETLDIHAGAVDLIFPHHENEIAQSEAASDKTFANFWLHGEHLLVDGQKMSKSLNNFYVLSDLEKKGYSPLDFRYFCLLGHFRTKLNFTWEGLEAAKNGLNNLRQNVNRLTNLPDIDQTNIDKTHQLFTDAINDDLNTPVAISELQNLINLANSKNQGGNVLTKLISDFDKVLGLDLISKNDIPQNIIDLAEKRLTAKKAGDYSTADKLRAEIDQAGYIIEDTSGGFRLLKK